jgi:hypothetical protein
LLDIATGWEEGGTIRVCLNPGPLPAKQPWPAVTVGKVRSPEDAVFADLDGDGRLEAVSSCEGGERTIYVHWAPRDEKLLLDSASWRTEPIPATSKQQLWMFAVPMKISGRSGVDLIVGSKASGATVSWLQAPDDGRNLATWKLRPLYQAGWIVSDRKGKNRGILWLENPGAIDAANGAPWKEHRLGGTGKEVMFLDLADLDGDGRKDIVCASRNEQIIYLRRAGDSAADWEEHLLENPLGIAGGKSVRAADLNGDGRMDLIHTAELGGSRERPGVVWMSYRDRPTDSVWDVHDISGREGNKFDLVQTLDLDADGDLDIIACEERDNLGLFWYENTTGAARR